MAEAPLHSGPGNVGQGPAGPAGEGLSQFQTLWPEQGEVRLPAGASRGRLHLPPSALHPEQGRPRDWEGWACPWAQGGQLALHSPSLGLLLTARLQGNASPLLLCLSKSHHLPDSSETITSFALLQDTDGIPSPLELPQVPKAEGSPSNETGVEDLGTRG